MTDHSPLWVVLGAPRKTTPPRQALQPARPAFVRPRQPQPAAVLDYTGPCLRVMAALGQRSQADCRPPRQFEVLDNIKTSPSSLVGSPLA
jgi:hypothetical protein